MATVPRRYFTIAASAIGVSRTLVNGQKGRIPQFLTPSQSSPIGPTSSLAIRQIPQNLPLSGQNRKVQRQQHQCRGFATGDRPNVGNSRFRDFELSGGVYLVTGGGRGLGLCLAEALVEAGGKVYCLDRLDRPSDEFEEIKKRVLPEFGGSLHYKRVDVQNTESLNEVVKSIADEHQRMDGLIAAAGIQQLTAAVDCTAEDARRMMDINYIGVFMTATAVARQMLHYKCRGSICLIASMSGQVANKGLISPVYNSSKAAVVQLARNLAMEWGRVKEDGSGGIRVNCLSPGNILTPMVKKNFEEVPGLKELWEKENMMGRISKPEEYKGAVLFLLSNASSFMTGGNLVIDGGYTAW